jgi:hypothetical protein
VTLLDQLSKLASHAHQLEISAEALKSADWASIEERKAALATAIATARVELGSEMLAAGRNYESDWVWDKVDISERFDSLKRTRTARHSERVAKRANHAAEAAEEVAAEEIDFAIYAIEEAEYAILDAINASVGAVLKTASTRISPATRGNTNVILLCSKGGTT